MSKASSFSIIPESHLILLKLAYNITARVSEEIRVANETCSIVRFILFEELADIRKHYKPCHLSLVGYVPR